MAPRTRREAQPTQPAANNGTPVIDYDALAAAMAARQTGLQDTPPANHENGAVKFLKNHWKAVVGVVMGTVFLLAVAWFILAVLVPMIPSGVSDTGNGGKSVDSTGIYELPALSTKLDKQSFFDKNYPAPTGYVWRLYDGKGKLPTAEWLTEVYELSKTFDDGTALAKSEQRNKFVRTAMRDGNVKAAYLEDENDDTGGVSFIVVYYDENNEVQVKEFSEDLMTFDLSSPDVMDDVFVTSEQESFFSRLQQELDNRTTSKPAVEQPATEQPAAQSAQPVAKSPVTAFVPVSLDGASPSAPAETSKVPAFKPVSLD